MSNPSSDSPEFQKGIKIRREVLGDAYVDRQLAAGSDPFGKPIQEYVTEVCWASWGRDGLTRKQRSLLNIAILMCLNRAPELAAHTRGAINNGLTEQEISEAIRHTMIYAGVPAGVDAFKTAGKVIREMKESGEFPASSSSSS
ncbi:AhpD-like protein [Xylogone sp. PMI_703]|nr:AhpD-like protein [Xylogone sp. PMI_703]